MPELSLNCIEFYYSLLRAGAAFKAAGRVLAKLFGVSSACPPDKMLVHVLEKEVASDN